MMDITIHFWQLADSTCSAVLSRVADHPAKLGVGNVFVSYPAAGDPKYQERWVALSMNGCWWEVRGE
jgi:hypothetical protein